MYAPTDEFKDEVHKLFNKKIKLLLSNWALPEKNILFCKPPWVFEQLQLLKNKLNFHKNQLNDFNIEKWSMHTRRRNPAGEVSWKVRTIINPEFLTQAWTKFYECAYTYSIIPKQVIKEKKMVSLHLCEAPGAFITSLNHYLKTNFQNIEWHWIGSTLNPYYEGNSLSSMISDDRFMFYTLQHWEFGIDNTGNLMDWDNSQAIIQRAKSLGKVMLVTADGSIDCLQRPEAQEEITSPLHYCEIVTALQALSKGGTFVFKLFTIFEHSTVNLLYLVSTLFEDVHIYKPVTSRQGNSEVYAICLSFAGSDALDPYIPVLKSAYGTEIYANTTLFPLECIPEEFLKQIYECAEFFCNKQCDVINSNLEAYLSNADKFTITQMRALRAIVGSQFIIRYNLKQLSWQQEILNGLLHQAVKINTNLKYNRGSYTERQMYEVLSSEDKLKYLVSFLEADVLSDPSIFLLEPVRWISLFNDKSNIDINFTYGKPISKINSSKFIFVPIFKLYESIMDVNQFRELLLSKNYLSSYPNFSCLSSKTISTPEFDYTELYEAYEKKCFKNIFNMLQTLKEGETMTIINFNLLTHFNVSVIYVLSVKCFEKIGFKDGNTVILQNLINKSGLQFIDLVNDEIKKVQSETKSIVNILPVAMTNSGEFYNNVVFFNNTIYRKKCVNYLQYITQTIDKNSQKSQR